MPVTTAHAGFRRASTSKAVAEERSKVFDDYLLRLIPNWRQLTKVRADHADSAIYAEVHNKLGKNWPFEIHVADGNPPGRQAVVTAVCYYPYQAPWNIFAVGLFFPVQIVANRRNLREATEATRIIADFRHD